MCDEVLAQMEKALHLGVEDINRKRVPTEGSDRVRKLGAYAETSATDPLKLVTQIQE